MQKPFNSLRTNWNNFCCKRKALNWLKCCLASKNFSLFLIDVLLCIYFILYTQFKKCVSKYAVVIQMKYIFFNIVFIL